MRKFDPRLKMDIDGLVEEILDRIDPKYFESADSTFVDPSMGGGQFIKGVEARLREYGHSESNISKRVFGFAENFLDIGWARNTHGLVAQLTTKNYFEDDMNFTVTLTTRSSNFKPFWSSQSI